MVGRRCRLAPERYTVARVVRFYIIMYIHTQYLYLLSPFILGPYFLVYYVLYRVGHIERAPRAAAEREESETADTSKRAFMLGPLSL